MFLIFSVLSLGIILPDNFPLSELPTTQALPTYQVKLRHKEHDLLVSNNKLKENIVNRLYHPGFQIKYKINCLFTQLWTGDFFLHLLGYHDSELPGQNIPNCFCENPNWRQYT